MNYIISEFPLCMDNITFILLPYIKEETGRITENFIVAIWRKIIGSMCVLPVQDMQ